jgi:uncharacterized protein YraI
MISFHRAGLFGLVLLAASHAAAETRMQVSAGSTPVYARPAADAPPVGSAGAGEILFVTRIENDWAAISPPDRIDLWLNKDFIEGNRVVANTIQIRSGPGIQYDIVGLLERGAPVMPRGEDGDWCKIAPPSSATLWVRKNDLTEVRAPTTPIREVTPVAAPAPVPAAPSEPAAAAAAPEASPAPASASLAPAPSPAPQAPAIPPAPAPAPVAASTPKVAPSTPQTSAAPPARRPAPETSPAVAPIATGAAPPRPVTDAAPPAPAPTAKAPARPQPVPRPSAAPPVPTASAPATAAPPVARAPRPASPAPSRPRTDPAARTVPAPAAVAAQKAPDPAIHVDPELVEDLDLAEGMPNQGKPVQVSGELRSAPFLAASPSRYRILDTNPDGMLEMVCHVHGNSEELRQYIGKRVSIRGREYWVDRSDMPVVVVGQIVPLSPVYEPVMY